MNLQSKSQEPARALVFWASGIGIAGTSIADSKITGRGYGSPTTSARMHFHSNRPTTAKRNPLLAPGWLPLVLRRIDDSTVLPGRTIQDCQEELTIEVGFAARRFFELYGDLLLGEPYLYATPYGDLAAEFSIGGTRLTAIVSERRLILFSVGSGEPSYRYVDDWLERPEVVAAAMRQIASPTSSVIV